MALSGLSQQVRDEIRRLNRVLAILEEGEEAPVARTQQPAPQKQSRKGRQLSPEARLRMKEAQERRWAGIRAEQQAMKSEPQPEPAPQETPAEPEHESSAVGAPAEPEKKKPVKKKR